ncbi:MBL fold metallo-hydrolase [Patescibacteria group bacterium]|nr:MBL fold metallo-hydrolase [Patescibacteria group bacterium]
MTLLRTKKIRKRLLITAILVVNTALIYYWLFVNLNANLSVSFLNIGQGDAILIQTPGEQNILIDSGDGVKIIEELSTKLDWFDRQIDLFILTHPHNDHIGGAIEVIKRYKVKEIMYTNVSYDSPLYLALLSIIKEKNIKTLVIDAPININFGNNCALSIIYPFEDISAKEFENINNSSVVSRLDCENKKFLLAGDVELEIEEILVEAEMDLKADVYKASHHGSDTSNGQAFLDLVQPEITIIQVGADNTFGHPSLRTLNRLERIGSKVYRNDLDGTIELYINNGELLYR